MGIVPTLDHSRPQRRPGPKIAIVISSDDPHRTAERLQPVAEALAEAAVNTQMVSFDLNDVARFSQEVRDCDGLLVWADPLTERGTRSTLDTELARLAMDGVWVSAHPDVITKIGTKDVLITTAHMSWGTDSYIYPTIRDFRDLFPLRLKETGTRVVKADRGNGGRTVWKVTVLDESSDPLSESTATTKVMVQHARHRDDTHTITTLEAFIARCAAAYGGWGGTGHLIDQPYQPRIREGLVRCYMVQSTVVGFALQDAPRVQAERPDKGPAQAAVLGVPSPKTMVPPDHPELQRLCRRLAEEWIPGMCTALDLALTDLPMLWDVDLIRGVPTASDPDPFVLCEINVSSVIPFPPDAPKALAAAVKRCLRG